MNILINCPLNIEYKNAKKMLDIKNQKKLFYLDMVNKQINQNNIFIIKSGIGKTRASIATVSGINYAHPDFILDTGSCGSLNDIPIGSIIISYCCYEYDISGYGFPHKKHNIMKIHSGFDNSLDIVFQDSFYDKNKIFIGIQACGEYIIKDNDNKLLLSKLFDADACNWESAGVFIGALNQHIPCLSIRVVSDLANEHLSTDYKNNIQHNLLILYKEIYKFIQQGVFDKLKLIWDINKIELIL